MRSDLSSSASIVPGRSATAVPRYSANEALPETNAQRHYRMAYTVHNLSHSPCDHAVYEAVQLGWSRRKLHISPQFSSLAHVRVLLPVTSQTWPEPARGPLHRHRRPRSQASLQGVGRFRRRSKLGGKQWSACTKAPSTAPAPPPRSLPDDANDARQRFSTRSTLPCCAAWLALLGWLGIQERCDHQPGCGGARLSLRRTLRACCPPNSRPSNRPSVLPAAAGRWASAARAISMATAALGLAIFGISAFYLSHMTETTGMVGA